MPRSLVASTQGPCPDWYWTLSRSSARVWCNWAVVAACGAHGEAGGVGAVDELLRGVHDAVDRRAQADGVCLDWSSEPIAHGRSVAAGRAPAQELPPQRVDNGAVCRQDRRSRGGARELWWKIRRWAAPHHRVRSGRAGRRWAGGYR
jgi:hypothetical protein